MSEKNFDLIVIGAGPGGYHSAIRASQLGLKVGLIEKDDGSGIGGLGGVCLNWGCIPSKSLLKNAELLNELKNPEEWGFSFKEFKADISKAIERSREVSSKLTQGIGYLIKKNNIEPIKAINEKLDPNLHQAMMEVEDDTKDQGTIVQEIQKGFMMKDRLLRPSLVAVSKKRVEEEQNNQKNQENLEKEAKN